MVTVFHVSCYYLLGERINGEPHHSLVCWVNLPLSLILAQYYWEFRQTSGCWPKISFPKFWPKILISKTNLKVVYYRFQWKLVKQFMKIQKKHYLKNFGKFILGVKMIICVKKLVYRERNKHALISLSIFIVNIKFINI